MGVGVGFGVGIGFVPDPEEDDSGTPDDKAVGLNPPPPQPAKIKHANRHTNIGFTKSPCNGGRGSTALMSALAMRCCFGFAAHRERGNLLNSATLTQPLICCLSVLTLTCAIPALNPASRLAIVFFSRLLTARKFASSTCNVGRTT